MFNIPEVERIKGVVGDRIVFHSDTNDYSLLINDIQRLMGVIKKEVRSFSELEIVYDTGFVRGG